jgi:hypothetical protein
LALNWATPKPMRAAPSPSAALRSARMRPPTRQIHVPEAAGENLTETAALFEPAGTQLGRAVRAILLSGR